MGERKVLNKYYPPDFDPSKLRRATRPKNQQINVRMMLSMSIRCKTCCNYIYKSTKFNSRKEHVLGEKYHGIQIFRFYFKCTKCSAEITMKTDPQNSDYIVESGATRNFEPWRAEDDDEVADKKTDETRDPMKSLENRTRDSKREMDIIAALDEMKSLKSRHEAVIFDEMLAALHGGREDDDKDKRREEEEEDDALMKSVVFNNSDGYVMRRIRDQDIESYEQFPKRQKVSEDIPGKATDSVTKASLDDSGKQEKLHSLVKISVLTKKPMASDVKSDAEPGGLQSLCHNYDSDEDY